MRQSIILLTLVSLLFFSCKSKKSAPSMPPLELKAIVASESEVLANHVFVTQTESLSSSTIEPRVAGYLKQMLFENGGYVKKGQLLFVIEPTNYENALASERASLAEANAQLVLATSNYNRAVPLSKINAISRSDFDSYSASLKSAKESVTSAKAAVANAALNLGYTKISAPSDGIIAAPEASIGDFVGVGTKYAILTTIADNSVVTTDLALSVNDYYDAISQNGDTIPNDSLLSNITLELANGEIYPHKGWFRFIEQNVNSNTGSVIIQTAFNNPNHILRAGEYSRVHADIGRAKNELLVDQQCLNQLQNIATVWIVKNGKAQSAIVECGSTYKDMWIIKSGIEKGDTVLTEGFAKLKEGAAVKPII